MGESRYCASLYCNEIPVQGSQHDNLDDLIAIAVTAMEGYRASVKARIVDRVTEQVVFETRKESCE